ncbi:MAG: glutamate formiminotransferase / 5-formyltetrahydrofolate cyclo-ligase [Actinomycetota bacterium]|nr:glutamate formiminotransferase / 5-formyltetrahydrofolate cyclo-ligase [Actinomycetota bacterium]
MLECVVNVSEGRDPVVIALLVAAGGRCLLDVHSDAHHHRSVLTLAGPGEAVEAAAWAVTAEAVARLDLRSHVGVHPRLGVVDVVPFVPLEGSTIDVAVAARDRFLAWAADELGLPGFAYGPPPERSLPEVRRSAFAGLAPSAGPPRPHPTAGAVCVGARPVLVAYNVWLAEGVGVDEARRVAAAVRRPGVVRALGLDVGGRAQVSMNLIAPSAVGPAEAFDAVRALVAVDGAELVGLLPAAVLEAVAPARWGELDLARSRTIEARLRDQPG